VNVLKSCYLLIVMSFLCGGASTHAAMPPATCIDMLNKKIAHMPPITEDISYLIADLKYDGKQVKICEFGEGTCSRFKGYDYMFGKGIIWERFWKILDEYDFPKWYIDPEAVDRATFKAVDKEIMLSKFLENRGYAVPSVGSFLKHPLFARTFCNKKSSSDATNLVTDGLVMIRHNDASIGQIANLRCRYKNLMVLNAAVAPFVNDKYTTDILFKEESLQRFRPQAMLCKRAYDPSLAADIQKKLPSEFYVIKPLNAFKGCGVMMLAAHDLDAVLKSITSGNARRRKTDQTFHFNGYSYTDRTYSYWDEYQEPYFIIEELCQSRIIEFEGKRYDPTMRVVFVLRHFNGVITVDYLAAYWKLPLKSLDEKGTLTEQHKSVGIIPIDTTEEERKQLYSQLDELLPQLYAKMISIINNRIPLVVPLQAG
jgi:hypothetical protein